MSKYLDGWEDVVIKNNNDKQKYCTDKEFFGFCIEYFVEYLIFPSRRVLQLEFGFSDHSGCLRYLKRLHKQGYLDKIDGKYTLNRRDITVDVNVL